MQQRVSALAFAFAAVIAATACGDDNSTPPGTVTSVAITGAPASLAPTRTATLTATVVVTNGASQTVTWTTSNSGVVSVAPSGSSATITAVAVGSATITATAVGDAQKSANAVITVVSPILRFAASLSPANEPPGLLGNPTGSGTYSAQLDTTTNVFTWTGSFSGLTSTINNGHIHGPFVAGSAGTANVLLNFDPALLPASATGASATFVGKGSATSGSVTGTITLNTALSLTPAVNGDSLRKLIIAGATYVNIHTVTNGGGEIRGQLTRQP